jgi:flagellar protein FlaG
VVLGCLASFAGRLTVARPVTGRDVIMQNGINTLEPHLEKAAAPVRSPEPLGRGTAASGDVKPVGRPVSNGNDQAPAFDAQLMRENLQEAIEHLNKQLASSGRNLGFTMDEILNRPIVKVTNTQTGELIRQIPSEAVIKVAHTLEELKGLLYDASI